MEIVREGTTKKIRFVCEECDCIFDADLGEAKVTRQGRGAFDYVNYTCRCPHCGYSCDKTVNIHCPEQRMQAIGAYGIEINV